MYVQVHVLIILDRVVGPGGPVGLVLRGIEPSIFLVLDRIVGRKSPIGFILRGAEKVLRFLFQDLVARRGRRYSSKFLEALEEVEVGPGCTVLEEKSGRNGSCLSGGKRA